MSERKSVLDNVPITGDCPNCGGIAGLCKCNTPKERMRLEVVGHCPSCGAPVYGKPWINETTVPQVKHSCNCWRRGGTIQQTMETK